MRRRDFIKGIAGSATWPLAARAQRSAKPVIGLAVGGSAAPLRRALAGFDDGLRQNGYVVAQNVDVEYRFAEGQFDRFPGFMSEFMAHNVSVIVTTNDDGAFAAKKATSTIPTVFSIGEDPVKLGLVSSFNRPGGNLTGVVQFTQDLDAKRLALLHEMIPKGETFGVLLNPNFATFASQLLLVEEAASRLGLKLVVVRANTDGEIDAAFSTVVQQRAQAILVGASPFFNSRRQQLVILAARHGLPAIYEWREFAEAGGLMSYGTRLADAFQQTGIYAGRLLNGDKPADLPIVQVTKFEFVINLSTAKALGIDVPLQLQQRADEVIE
jgi:putative ABC transport system substrate-binding protein